jgi:hypothetical protein
MNKHFPRLFVITFLGFITACTEGSMSLGNQSVQSTKTIKAVDDPNSVYYNQIVDQAKLVEEGKKNRLEV